MSLAKVIDFNLMNDDRGGLIALEGNRNIPFDIKRVYCIFGVSSGVERGYHAHHELMQVVVCLSGACTFVLDDGKNKEEVTLNSRSKGLLIDKKLWRVMKNFTSDCVLMVLASDYFDEKDYIRNYDEFIKIVKNDTFS